MQSITKYWYLILLLGVLVLTDMRSAILTVLMIVSGSVIALYRNIIPFNIGLELVTFYSITLCFAVNPIYAWIVAVIIIVFSHIITAKVCLFMVVKILVYGALCLLAFLLRGLGVENVGKIAVILKNLVFLVVTYFMNPGRGIADAPSNLMNIMLNFFFFTMWAEPLLSLFD